MGKALQMGFSRLTDFSGRSRRSEFWYVMLVVLLLDIVLGMMLGAMPLVSAIVQSAVMFLGLSVTVRRLQDTGKNGMWVYASYVLGILSTVFTAVSGIQEKMTDMADDPNALARLFEHESGTMMTMGLLSALFMLSSFIVFIFCLMDGTPNANKYGESPKYVER